MAQTKTSKNCLIYCRVSTDKQAQYNESLGQQEKICRGIANSKNLNVLRVYRESESGRKDEGKREKLKALQDFSKKNKDIVDYVIFRDIDRLTRGGSRSYLTFKEWFANYGVDFIDSYGMIQPAVNTLEHLGIEFPWSRHSPSSIAENIKAETSSDEVRTILTRLIGTEIQCVRDGYRVGTSNYGYENKKVYIHGKKKTTLIPSKKRLNILRKCLPFVPVVNIMMKK